MSNAAARLSLSGKSYMMSTADNLFTKYIHTMHPNTLDPKEYYWFGWSKEEREALEMISARHKGVVTKCNSLTLASPTLANRRDFLSGDPMFKLYFGNRYDSWPYPEITVKDTDVYDPDMRSKLLSWTTRYFQLMNWYKHFDHYSHALVWGGQRVKLADGDKWHVSPVNTPGQLYRAWPEYASLVEKKYADRMASQKLKSAMPVGWTSDSLDNWRKLPYMDEINEVLLAISVMKDDLTYDRRYPD